MFATYVRVEAFKTLAPHVWIIQFIGDVLLWQVGGYKPSQ